MQITTDNYISPEERYKEFEGLRCKRMFERLCRIEGISYRLMAGFISECLDHSKEARDD